MPLLPAEKRQYHRENSCKEETTTLHFEFILYRQLQHLYICVSSLCIDAYYYIQFYYLFIGLQFFMVFTPFMIRLRSYQKFVSVSILNGRMQQERTEQNL